MPVATSGHDGHVPARFLHTYPCQDACGVRTTGRTVEGAVVYACPGCDTEWIELDERTPPSGEAEAEASDTAG